MALEILMPALSPTMTEGNLAKWLKKEGDKVKPGEVIAEIETDKATMEVESADSGILGKILIPAGTENVKVNQLIGILVEDGDDKNAIESIISKHGKTTNKTPQTSTTQPKNSTPEYKPEPLTALDDGKTEEIRVAQKQFVLSAGKVFSSPLARRIAAQSGLDINSIAGSGPNGRVIKSDVLAATSSQTKSTPKTFAVGRNATESYLEPLTQMRKVVAKRLLESKQTVPHFYLSVDCILTELSTLRTLINNKAKNANAEPEYKISVNDFIIKACAHALNSVPAANASWSDSGIVHYNNIDISVAVAINDGLITPIIKNADQKSLSQISIEMKNLAARAKQNALRPEEFQGGGFSISNLGMYGIKEFKAIVNPPQACILAVGASEKRAVVTGDKIEIAEVMTLSLSCDHRVVDGALAAQLLTTMRSFIENPSLMLV